MDSLTRKKLVVNIPPATLEAHKANYIQYNALQEVLREAYFTDVVRTAGIHLNVDYHMLGENKSETVKKLMQFMYNNRDFMVKVSLREGRAQELTDMDTFLGDMYNLSDKQEKFEEFIFHKNLIEEFFNNSDSNVSHSSIFNISLSKKGRRCMELRWFGTTLDINKFYSIIELGYALIYFCRSHKFHELDLEYFGRYVSCNAERYRNLHEILLDIPEISSYAVLTAQ